MLPGPGSLARQLGVRQRTWPSGGKGGSDPPVRHGGPPGCRRAGKPFEKRGAAGHWSPGWGVGVGDRATALEGTRTRESSPFRSGPPTALELAEEDGEGLLAERNWGGGGAPASLLAQRRDDEGGKFLGNRSAPLRRRRRSRPSRPAGARGAGTALRNPGGAGAAT